MTIYINGQPETVADRYLTLYQMLDRLGAKETAVSVSVNDVMMPRTRWRIQTLSNFDRVDFV